MKSPNILTLNIIDNAKRATVALIDEARTRGMLAEYKARATVSARAKTLLTAIEGLEAEIADKLATKATGEPTS